jgi:digalactosyldiacylglycerol synthase
MVQQNILIGAGVTAAAIALQRRQHGQLERKRKDKATAGSSSLRVPGRHVVVVATAGIPWMTGTAVNPTLRAAYLAKCTDLKVSLMVPWIAEADQKVLFKDNVHFSTPQEQVKHIFQWVKDRAGFEASFRVIFYPAEYNKRMLGVFPIGDPILYVPEEERDVAVLEEPEHLTWFHHGVRWTDHFPHVVGIMHTNYAELSRRTLPGPAGVLVGFVSRVMNACLCAIHTHKIIKLSDAVQPLPRQATQYVHGAPGCFLDIGDEASQPAPDGQPRFSKGAYTLGKMVWGKGWEELLELLERQRDRGEPLPELAGFGSGEAEDSIHKRANDGKLNIKFMGRVDHLDPQLRPYKVFVNASTSDVVATTSVEALAMGKWVVAAQHPCNEFISQFHNALIYTTPEEFSAHLLHAADNQPKPLTKDERYQLSWEAATERFLDAAELEDAGLKGPLRTLREASLFTAYNAVMGVEALRQGAGATPGTRDTPAELCDVDLQARAEREKAAKQGWYRNAHGQMSFSDLAGVNIRVSSGGGGGSGEGPAAAPRAPAAAAAAESRATDAAGAR